MKPQLKLVGNEKSEAQLINEKRKEIANKSFSVIWHWMKCVHNIGVMLAGMLVVMFQTVNLFTYPAVVPMKQPSIWLQASMGYASLLCLAHYATFLMQRYLEKERERLSSSLNLRK